jgi:shikimate dehydrogenase
MKKFIVIGNPIKHSLSPLVHNYWFKINNIEANYEKRLVEDKDLKLIIEDIKKEKIVGANVTVPFKQKIIPLIDELSEIAQITNSVNTIYKKNNKIIGDNTDVFGFTSSLSESLNKKKLRSALLLGAGGVAPSIICSLKQLDCEEILVANRTAEKFNLLKNKFGPIVKQIFWEDLNYRTFNVDLVINATSLGLHENDKIPINIENISKNAVFFDVIYNPNKTNFLKTAEKRGHVIINGLMMFLYQAQMAYEIWNKAKPIIDEKLLTLMKNT